MIFFTQNQMFMEKTKSLCLTISSPFVYILALSLSGCVALDNFPVLRFPEERGKIIVSPSYSCREIKKVMLAKLLHLARPQNTDSVGGAATQSLVSADHNKGFCLTTFSCCSRPKAGPDPGPFLPAGIQGKEQGLP